MEKQHFYSFAPNLSISADKGKEQRGEGGVFRRVGEKLIQFQDVGDGYQDEKGVHIPLGRFYTEDQQLVKFLEDRCEKERDVITQAEYNRLIIPPAQREATYRREIEEKNKLIADLQKKK
jgi:hypothetical protein